MDMLRRHSSPEVTVSLAAAMKSILLSRIRDLDPHSSDRYRSIMVRFRRLLNRYAETEKSPSAYADMLNISEIYLNEAVKTVTGISVSRYIRRHIVLLAKWEFIRSRLSAKEVAYKLGFCDYAYFSRLFTKETGLSPSAYRRSLI